MTKKERSLLKGFFCGRDPHSGAALDIKAVWPSKGRALAKKYHLSSKELDQLYQTKLDRGLRNIPILSFFLIRESQEARRAGDDDLSVRLANSSIKFSPDLYPTYFELARPVRQNAFQFDKIIPSFLDGLNALTSYFSSSLHFYYNLFYILANAILLTFMLFGIVVLVKYFPLFVYDIRKDLTQEITKVVLNGLRIFITFCSVLFASGHALGYFYWNILLWGICQRREAIPPVFSLSFSFTFLRPAFGILLSGESLFGRSPGDEQGELRRLGWATEQKLEAWLAAHP